MRYRHTSSQTTRNCTEAQVATRRRQGDCIVIGLNQIPITGEEKRLVTGSVSSDSGVFSFKISNIPIFVTSETADSWPDTTEPMKRSVPPSFKHSVRQWRTTYFRGSSPWAHFGSWSATTAAILAVVISRTSFAHMLHAWKSSAVQAT